MIFGYFVPSLRRRRMRNSPIAIASFGRDTKSVIPARPTGNEPQPPRAAAPSPAQARDFAPAGQQVPVPVVLDRKTIGMDALSVEARAARGTEIEQEHKGVFKLQVAGDQRHSRSEGVASSNLRLEKAPDGTLQFLPGKLEIVEGRDVGQELRFVRTPGPDGQTITFGRSEGAQYRHIQLHEATVSRDHARMALDGKTWTLTNLSRTNPVSVNGLAMSEDTPSVVLRDGDRIEMGEVVFRFRAR